MTQHTLRVPLSKASRRQGDGRPPLLHAVESIKAGLSNLGAAGLAARLSRPRFLRGPSTERPLRARRIRTARLELRPHSMADAERWYALQSDPDVVRHLSWPVRDEAASRAHLKARTRHVELSQADDFLALAVVEDGLLVGDVSLQLRAVTREVRSAEMGWIVAPDRARRGYATEASLAVARLAFDELGVRIVTAVILTANVRSIALARRLGFREAHREGDEVLYTLTAEDFRRTLAANAQLRGLIGSA